MSLNFDETNVLEEGEMEGRGCGEERVERIGKEQIKEWKCE